MNYRVGIGYDVHAFTDGDHLMLGGVRIPYQRGVRAHSDGDVLIHALCDALLGAAALGDIGQHFSDTDERWRGRPSRDFLQQTLHMLAGRGYHVINADLTLIAEAPRLGSWRDDIKQTLAKLLQVPSDAVNIKATTHERLGALGRGEGIAAQAVVLVGGGR